MILDTIQNSAQYDDLNPYFKEALQLVRNYFEKQGDIDESKLENDNFRFLINDSVLKSKEEAKLETHEKYIDIQFPMSANEVFGWLPKSDCKLPLGSFNEEKDILFYEDIPSTYVTVNPGQFVVFFPEDGHAPCIGDGKINKVIIKVKDCRL